MEPLAPLEEWTRSVVYRCVNMCGVGWGGEREKNNASFLNTPVQGDLEFDSDN